VEIIKFGSKGFVKHHPAHKYCLSKHGALYDNISQDT
jgi:hypothetical protein